MHPGPAYALLAASLMLCLPASVSAKPRPSATVEVDCTDPDPTKHDSINDALTNPAEELIIEITGMCHEHVVIHRSYVTLIGTDPAVDGIKGPVEGEPYEGLVEVGSGATAVELKNLTVAGSGKRGVWVRTAGRVKITNCWLLDNDLLGFQASDGYAWILNTRFAGNGWMGARLNRGGRLICDGCVFKDNGDWEVSSVEASHAYLDNSEISGQNGVLAETGGFVGGDNSSITAIDRAILAVHQGEVIWSGGPISGGILALVKAVVSLDQVTQGDSFSNLFLQDSTLEIQNSSLLGNTTLNTFSNGAAWGSTVFGTLSCLNGANLYCDAEVTKSSSSCGLCLVPVP